MPVCMSKNGHSERKKLALFTQVVRIVIMYEGLNFKVNNLYSYTR